MATERINLTKTRSAASGRAAARFRLLFRADRMNRMQKFGAWLPVIYMFCVGSALAQGYPAKSIRIVVPFPPGGNSDVNARIIAQPLQELLGQTVVIENRSGAGGMIGSELVAKAPADGYTLVLGSDGPTTISPLIYRRPPYDPIRDFAPVSMLSLTAMVIVVHPLVPAKNVKELIALAKARPGTLLRASGGVGTANHIAGESFQTLSGTRMTHVPYKGTPLALVDLMGGHVDLLFDTLPSVISYIKQGKVRALAVTTQKRATALPDVQTVEESAGIKGYEANVYTGLLAPAGTPKEILSRLASEVAKALGTPTVRERFLELGAEPQAMSPEEFARFLRDTHVKLGKVITAANIKVD
jgi:tripartite-type tricarboxylate transporter receptor subunit TctC